MKKNLLQSETRAGILERIDKLSPSSKSEWGKMNVNQMLWHTSHGLKSAMGEFSGEKIKSSAIKRGLMRFVVFKTNFPTPKAKAETFGEINTVARGINPENFEAERKRLKELIQQFPESAKYASESPIFGPMTKHEWAILQYGHLDHHLKQFGA